MKSGLEGRNNITSLSALPRPLHQVSMKSGLEGRNNRLPPNRGTRWLTRLNEVRPGRPEQFDVPACPLLGGVRLNEVRPGRPEQSGSGGSMWAICGGLNEVRPGRPEQSGCRALSRVVPVCLNEVRPGRPEQSWAGGVGVGGELGVSMKSGLEGRNNGVATSIDLNPANAVSQ